MSPPQPPRVPEALLMGAPSTSSASALGASCCCSSSSSTSSSPSSSALCPSSSCTSAEYALGATCRTAAGPEAGAGAGQEDDQTSARQTAAPNILNIEQGVPIQDLDRASRAIEGPLTTSGVVAPNSPLSTQENFHALAADPSNMIFSDLYKGRKSPLSKLRQQKSPAGPHQFMASPPAWLDKEHADLHHKDKLKQKEAIKRYIAAKVKSDWEFHWPVDTSGPASSISQRRTGRGRKRSWLMQRSSDDVSPHTKTAVGEEERRACENGHGSKRPPRRRDTAEKTNGSGNDHNRVDVELGDDVDNVSCSSRSSYADDSDAESVYSVVSEDNVNFRPRLDWASELSDDGEDIPSHSNPCQDRNYEAEHLAARRWKWNKRASRRRANREEMAWNQGLACFEARRDAWTGARTVRVREKASPPSSTSPRSVRCFFFPRSMSGSTAAPSMSGFEPSSAGKEGSVTTFDAQSSIKSEKVAGRHGIKNTHHPPAQAPADAIPESLLPVQTLLPLPYPILPPTNVLRASITPSVYLGLYDKVILNSLTPTCPINLSDMLKACVVGWKRDGEWPPPTKAVEPVSTARKRQQQQQQPVSAAPPQSKRASAAGSETMSTARRLSFGLLGRGDDESRASKGIRRSLQKALGLGTSPPGPAT